METISCGTPMTCRTPCFFCAVIPQQGKSEDAELLYQKLTTVLASVYGESSPETLSAATCRNAIQEADIKCFWFNEHMGESRP